MKVKINEKWFEGRYNDERKFIIPLSEEQDVIFFYKWQKNIMGLVCQNQITLKILNIKKYVNQVL